MVSKIIQCLSLAVLSVALEVRGENLLPGGDFEDGTMQGWGCHPEKEARASGAVEAVPGAAGKRALKIAVTVSQKANHVQVTCPFPTAALSAGEVYELSFRVRAVPPRAFSTHLLGNVKPWTNAGLRERVETTEEWGEKRLLFRANPPPQENVKVDFFLGDQTGDVWFDDIVLSPCKPPAAMALRGPTLTNGDCRISFTERGAIARITDTVTDRILVGGLAPAPVFECELRNSEGTVTRTSVEAEQVKATVTPRHVVHAYTYPDMTITTTITAIEGSSLFTADIAIVNRGQTAITSVRYPILNAPAQLGDTSEDDVFLYPRCDGGIVENPLHHFGGAALNDTYPGPLSCQVMALYDEKAGLYIATHDPDGNPKRFNARLKLDLAIAVEHLLPIVGGRDVRMGYSTVLGVFHGDWYVAAEIYRDWAFEQSWCAKTLLQRKDTPAWIRKGGVVTCYNPRARTKEGAVRFDDGGLRDFCTKFTTDFGLPAIPNNRGWERYGEWCGQEYFPPYPDMAVFRRQAQIIRDTGGLGMIMLSGWRWTIDKPQGNGEVHSNQESFDREIYQYATCEADGETPQIKTSDKPRDWHGTKYARLCPATSFAKRCVIDTAKACVAAGYPIVHFDQEVSGPAATSFCGSTNHGHEPGYGPWMHQAMAEMYQELRRECEPLSPDFTLSMEEPNELYLPWLNICQSRPNGLTNQFPMKPPLTRVVPLFSFLYHEYLVGWIAFYPWRSAGHHVVTVAQGFAAGMMPGVHIESTNRWKPPQREAFTTMVRNCCKLYAGEGQDALVFGRMLRPLTLDVPIREYKISKGGTTIRVPAVYHSVWQTADGTRCTTLFNPEENDHTVHIPGVADPVTVPAFGARLVRLL